MDPVSKVATMLDNLCIKLFSGSACLWWSNIIISVVLHISSKLTFHTQHVAATIRNYWLQILHEMTHFRRKIHFAASHWTKRTTNREFETKKVCNICKKIWKLSTFIMSIYNEYIFIKIWSDGNILNSK